MVGREAGLQSRGRGSLLAPALGRAEGFEPLRAAGDGGRGAPLCAARPPTAGGFRLRRGTDAEEMASGRLIRLAAAASARPSAPQVLRSQSISVLAGRLKRNAPIGDPPIPIAVLLPQQASALSPTSWHRWDWARDRPGERPPQAVGRHLGSMVMNECFQGATSRLAWQAPDFMAATMVRAGARFTVTKWTCTLKADGCYRPAPGGRV